MSLNITFPFRLVNLLQAFSMASSSSFRYLPHGRECSICKEQLEGRVTVLECGHVYHERCLANWKNSNNQSNVINIEEPEDMLNTEKCPECRSFLIVHKVYPNYVDYKGKLDTDGKSEVEKRAIEKKKKKNKKRFERKMRKDSRVSNNVRPNMS